MKDNTATLITPCQECGTLPDGQRWLPGSLRPGYCHGCTHWLETLEQAAGNPRWLLCEGRVYFAGTRTEKTPAKDRGMGGSEHFFQFEEGGEVIQTVDLWHTGELPARFMDRAPRKARRITREEFDALTSVRSVCDAVVTFERNHCPECQMLRPCRHDAIACEIPSLGEKGNSTMRYTTPTPACPAVEILSEEELPCHTVETAVVVVIIGAILAPPERAARGKYLVILQSWSVDNPKERETLSTPADTLVDAAQKVQFGLDSFMQSLEEAAVKNGFGLNVIVKTAQGLLRMGPLSPDVLAPTGRLPA